MEPISNKYGGIYFHIPFCIKKCPYCDFYSIADLSMKSRYLKALISEVNMTSAETLVFDTLYLGGGTPSVYEPADLETILNTAHTQYNIILDAEVTLEVNPGTVTLDSLNAYREIGINRLNIGIQSFQDANLKFLGRIHSAHDANAAFKWARESGFKNIGIDLIYGLPKQTRENWLRDLEYAIKLNPEHLSCYMLTCEPGTPLHRDLQAGRYRPLPDENIRELFDLSSEYLEHKGYKHYETSNFARVSKPDALPNISRHNLKYWTFAPYLGFGASAHSFSEPQRRWNLSNVNEYIRKIEAGRLPSEETEELTTEQLIMEAIYLGLRTYDGINVIEFKNRFGIDFLVIYKETIADLKKEGRIKVEQNRVRLTREGMFFLDSITAMFTSQEIDMPECA
jgi:oxygen-independent coproporphyrinogen-3 oxidase